MKKLSVIISAFMLTIFSIAGQAPMRKPLPQKPLPSKNAPSRLPPNNSDSESLGATIGNSLAEGINTFGRNAVTATSIPIEGYPNVSLMLGLSRYAGEFARIKWNIGGMGGFSLFGSIGKDWIWDLSNKDKLAWNFGLGYYFAWESTYSTYANNAFDISIAFGETPIVANYGLLVEFEYEHWFGNDGRFGVFGSTGLGLGDTKDKEGKFIWDIAAGIAIKLWQN